MDDPSSSEEDPEVRILRNLTWIKLHFLYKQVFIFFYTLFTSRSVQSVRTRTTQRSRTTKRIGWSDVTAVTSGITGTVSALTSQSHPFVFVIVFAVTSGTSTLASQSHPLSCFHHIDLKWPHCYSEPTSLGRRTIGFARSVGSRRRRLASGNHLKTNSTKWR